METQHFERFLASAIYLLTGMSAAYIFSVGLANGIASGYDYPIQQKLLIGAALTGAATLLLSAILVHFRPAAAYAIATVATLLLWLAFLPLLPIITQVIIKYRELLFLGDGFNDEILAVLLLSGATVFSLLRVFKVEFLKRGWFVRHWALLLAIALWLLMLASFFQLETIRAVVAVACIALLMYQWLIYRKTANAADFVFLSLIVAAFGLANVWLAFNVARVYTYDPESTRAWAWHSSVVRAQEKLAWGIALLVVFVSVWALFRLARWLATHVSSTVNRI